MALKVIGAGVGRTGTSSLKIALEMLGFGRCYHMEELAAHPEHVPLWLDAANGKTVPWDDLFDGYRSAVDLPSYALYETLMAQYPDAGVILTLRDPEKWYESASQTIFRAASLPPAFVLRIISLFSARMQGFVRILPVVRRIGLEDFFGGDTSKEHAIRVFNWHNEAVQQTVPAEKLLVYEVGQGWEPLCSFLEVPIPGQPFPHANTRAEFGA